MSKLKTPHPPPTQFTPTAPPSARSIALWKPDRVSLAPARRGGQPIQYKLWDTNLPGNLYSSSSHPLILGPSRTCVFLWIPGS